MKGIKNWLKAALVIGLIVLINYYSLLAIQIETYVHVEYTILPVVFYTLLSFLIGVSCGWVIKGNAEQVTQYTILAAILFLVLLFPVLYFLTPMAWIPSFFGVFINEYRIESLVFGLFSVLAIKSRIAYVKAKKTAV